MMKKSMKKIICVMMAAVMILAMGVTAFAANSPKASGVVTANTGRDAKGRTFNFSLGAYSGSFSGVVASIQSKEGLKAALGSAYVDGMEVVDVRSVSLNGADVTYPITLTFNVPGVTAGTKVAVLAYVNGQWVVLNCTAGNGTVTVTFENADQLEMVAFVVDKNTASAALKTSTGNNVSPKTGESAAVPAMAAMAVVLLIGGAYCLRKREVR